jgi:hypothetical protein
MLVLQGRNVWVIACFSAYVVLLFLFAGLYYRLYLGHFQRFLFSAGVIESQRETYKQGTERRIRCLEGEVELLVYLESHLVDRGDPRSLATRRFGDVLPSGIRFDLSLGSSSSPSTDQSTPPVATLTDANGSELTRVTIPFPAFWSRWDEVLLKRRYRRQAAVEIQKRRLAALATGVHDIWSYWDFLYFSTVCQTTLGFGDILPNATSVRLLVVFQVVAGYALIVVLLNVVFLP